MTSITTKVTFRGLAHSDALEQVIRERIEWLGRFDEHIQACSVTVETPHRHRHGGKPFHVRIEISIPRRPALVVSHEPSLHAPLKDTEVPEHHKDTDIDFNHQDAHLAVREAFDVARRRLLDTHTDSRHRPSVRTFENQT